MNRLLSTATGTNTGTWLAALLLLALGGSAGPADAKVFLSLEEALQLAYPGCEVERSTIFLDEEQLRQAREAADAEIESGLVYPYQAVCDGEPSGTAYFDSHRVRTLPETIMVAVDAEAKLLRVEVLAFREPEDYIPRDIWYRQFDGEALDQELDLQRGIRSVTGATLTARATTEAVRRVLAIHQVLNEPDPAE
jgi:hypothetical protein